MPEGRRTRAMGHSPGGPKALDINAPTRQSRKAKTPAAPKDAPAPARKTTRARSGPKRKNEDDIAEEPPAKKSRRNKPTEESEAIASDSQALAPLPDSESENLPGSTSSSQEEDPALEPEKIIELRVNAQQPTPPLDTPGEASTVRPITKAHQANLQEDTSLANAQRRIDRKNKNDKRISDTIRLYHTMRHEEEEDAKALSECDDDEWAQRYSTVMEQARNPTPFIATSKGDCEKWIHGSTAMFVVRKPNQNDIAAGNKTGPCMPPSSFSPSFFTTVSHLAAMGVRPLTNLNTIVAVSASLDWYEKNPSIAAPTPAEMAAMLDNFARAKQAQQAESANPGTTQTLQTTTSDAPLTPRAQVTRESLAEIPHLLVSDDGHSNTDRGEPGMEHNGDLTADVDQNRVKATEPQTPKQQQGPQGPRTWSSALSASAIGLLTPLNNWFNRRDRNRRNIAATEPRQVRHEPEVTQPAKSHEKPHSRDTPAQSSKTLPAKKNFFHGLKANLASDSPTPAASQPRRGRPDSHLPVHLRGVLFEDLPAEWQAVSEHLKKPKQAQVEHEEDEPVDMEYLLATAKRSRKERERKELQEQAELIAQKQRDLESDDEFSGDHVDRKGKKRVTFSPQKTYSAKLGHSTFGLPANIDESSSEDEPEFLGPRTHFGRNSRPIKSCLKRSYEQPTCEDYNEEDDGQDGYEPRPAKRVRLDEFASSQSSDIPEGNDDIPWRGEGFESFLYDDDPHRARPFSRFISKPPSELRTAEAAQMEFDRLNPRSRGQGFNSQVNRKSQYQKDESGHLNVFASGDSNQIEDWHKLFRVESAHKTAARHRYSTPLPYGGPRRPLAAFPSPRHENGRLMQGTVHLREASEARLNKKREDAMKHKPKTSSSLQVTRTLSPIQEKLSWKNMSLDEEVLRSIALLDDEDIVAESFGKYPDHVEATVSREASKAVEYPTWFDKASRGRDAMFEEAVKAAEVAEVEGES